MALSDSVATLKGVGASKEALLRKLGIETLEDLITYFPRTYEDRTKMCTISELIPGESRCFTAMVVKAPRTSYIRRGLNSTRCTIADSSAQVRVTWFNQPWMSKNLKAGETYCFYGALTGAPGLASQSDTMRDSDLPADKRDDLPSAAEPDLSGHGPGAASGVSPGIPFAGVYARTACL